MIFFLAFFEQKNKKYNIKEEQKKYAHEKIFRSKIIQPKIESRRRIKEKKKDTDDNYNINSICIIHQSTRKTMKFSRY